VLALAVIGAFVAAAFSPPGRAVLDGIRDAIAPTRIERSSPALFSLRGGGRLLVDSSAGVWVVDADGSKRLLADYRESSWSPHGLYIVAAGRNRLAALEPGGVVRWTLARRRVRHPRWGGTLSDTRIAYFTGRGRTPMLRVVAGDGTGDHRVDVDALDVVPAWRPGPPHVLAVAHADGRIRLWTDTGRLLATSPAGERPIELEWSSDGKRLFALARHRLRILDPKARQIAVRRMPAGWTASAMSTRPEGSAVAVVRAHGRESQVVVLDRGRERQAFTGTGRVAGVEWAPDGSRLLIALEDADQWVFLPWGAAGKIDAVSNVSAEFGSDRFPQVAGWCCAR
jgi:hypothetical protein